MTRRMSGAIITSVFALLASAGSAGAQEVEFTPNASVVSDYVFRGISQTLQEAAIQGGIDASLSSGLYAGIWGSSVNFGETNSNTVANAHMEFDAYAGIAPSVSGFDLDVGGIFYAYPGAASSRNYNYLEAFGSVTRAFGPFSAGLSGAWSPDFFAASGSAIYYGADVGLEIPDAPISFSATIGQQAIEDNAAFGTPDYLSWLVGASLDVLGVSIGASVTGTDLEESDCFGGSELCKTRAILSVGM